MIMRLFLFTFSRHLLRLLPILVLGLVSTTSLWAASGSNALSAAEAWVLSEVSQGKTANLEGQPAKELSASFLEALLTGKNSISRPEVSIENAVVKDTLRLDNQEIPFHVVLKHCHFEKGVNFYQATFKKGLVIQYSEFDKLEMIGATIIGIVEARETVFASTADFTNAKITGYISLEKATFNGGVSFTGSEIGNNLNINGAKFLSKVETANFETMKVGNDVFLRQASFMGPVKFSGAVIRGNFEANNAEFKGQRIGQGSGPRFDDMKFDGGVFSVYSFQLGSPPARLGGMEYRSLEVGKNESLLDLAELAEFSTDFYAGLEEFLQKSGQPEKADKVFVRMKQRQRATLGWPAYLGSLFLDWSVAYGRQPSRAFLWSGLVVLIGCLVFRQRSGMQAQDPKDESRPYNPFWYSLDLFAPVINLESADAWMPKQDRPIARHYANIHRILGWILLPIGLAALTGLIK
jgi:hypothetical protein